jgi:outer membrane protein insertion porin family
MASKKTYVIWLMLISVSFSFATFAQEEGAVIKEIKYEGLFRTRENLIAYKIKSQKGSKLSQDSLIGDQKRLIETGYFQDVLVKTEAIEGGVQLIFIFREKPLLQDVIISGNHTIKSEKITKKILAKVGRGEIFDDIKLHEAISEIEEMYTKKGFHDIKVDYRPQKDVERNEVTIEIVVDEGERGFVKQISFVGRQNIEESALLKVMETKRRRPIAWLFGKGDLKRDVLKDDEYAIKALYQNKGYLDAKVIDIKLEPMQDKPEYLHLIITLEEGQKYSAGEISLVGNTSFTVEELLKNSLIKKGDVLSMEIIEKKERQRLSDFYSEKGYVDVIVTQQRVPTDTPNTLNIVYTIKEGPKVRIGKIEISGNITTKDKVIRRELPLNPGEMYDGVKVRTAISRLNQLSYFSKVDVYPVETGKADVRDLMVEVEEKNTGQLMFGLGFSSIDQLVGTFEVSQSNFDYKDWPTFRGAGQKARLRVGFGTERQDYLLSFTEPWLFDKKISFGFDIFKYKKKYLSDVYEQDAYGGRLKLSKEIYKRTRAEAVYGLQKVKIKPEDDASPAIQAEAGDRTVSSLKFGVINDTRNSYVLTTRGWYRRASFEYAGGFLQGDTDFTREELELTRYIPIYGTHVVKLLGEYGTMKEFGDSEDVPIFERYFLGGRNTIHGYDFRNVGPKDETGEPLGGKSMLLLSAEYTYPIYETFLRGAVFYDTGNVWTDSYEFDSNDLRAGWGIGLRIIIPKLNIPVNLDYSWPLDPDEFDEDKGRFDFSLGFDF